MRLALSPLALLTLAGCTFDGWQYRPRDAGSDVSAPDVVDVSAPDATDTSAPDVTDASDDADAGCATGYASIAGECTVAPPRLRWPPSGAVLSTRRPTLKLTLATGTDSAVIEVCRDRACSTVEETLDPVTSTARLTRELSPGPHWWRSTSRIGARDGTAHTPTWELVVGTRSAAVEAVIGRIFDLDGDGRVDVAAGRPTPVSGAADVRTFRSGGGGLAWPGDTLSSPDGSARDEFGGAIAAAGDVDGDGFGDLVVGARRARSSHGSAWLYRGGVSAPSTPARVDAPNSTSDEFGYTVAGAGDVDGDGYGDALISTSGAASDLAEVFWYRGGPAGLTRVGVLHDDDFRIYHAVAAGVGDLDADGYGDVVVGASAATGGGQVMVYRGGARGLSTTPDVRLPSPEAGASFGLSVSSAGDFNGDGYADLVVGGGDASGGGRAWIYFGSASGVTPSSRVALTPGSESAQAGYAVAGGGDLNGDGYSDVVVGAPTSLSSFGRAYVYLGSSDTSHVAVSATLAQSPPDLPMTGANVQFGHALSMTGDVDGDGFGDVVVGAPSNSNPPQQRVEVFRGATGGVTTPAMWVIASPSRGDFGIAVAQ